MVPNWLVRPVRLLLVAAVAGAIAACASVDVRAHAERFSAGEVDGLRAELAQQAALRRSDGNAHLVLLQRSVLDLAAGQPVAGITALRQARDRLNDLRAASYGHWIEAALLDDRCLPYDGADYEHVLVRTMLALQDLVAQTGDAHAYLHQMLHQQVEIREKFVTAAGERPKLRYKLAAIGNWLLAAVDADDPMRGVEVQRQLGAVLEQEPCCALAGRELERFNREGFAPAGCGVVQIVALVGLGPYRVARDEPVSSSVLDAVRLVYNALHKRETLPLNRVRAVQVPELRFHAGNPTEAHVRAGGVAAATEVVTDVEELARAEFEAMRALVVTRAALRRAFKLALSEATKAAIQGKRRSEETPQERRAREREDTRRARAVDAVTTLALGLEAADLRCWSLLPASFQAARLVLPEGEHDIEVRAGLRGAAVGPPRTVRVRVRAGRTTFVVAQLPSAGLVPPVQSSERG